MNANTESFKSDSDYVWFTLLGFKGDDLLIFINNFNAIYANQFDAATITPANVNAYNKTAGTFFANVAVKQIGDTSFEQSDFPAGHTIITANPKFTPLVEGCEQTRMSFKHNGLGSNRGTVVGYVAPDKCPGLRANEFTFDLYTKLIAAITDQNAEAISNLNTTYWMEVRYSTTAQFTILVHSAYFAKLENLFFLAMEEGDIKLFDGTTAKLGSKESLRGKLAALASERRVSEDPTRTAIIFNLSLDATSESIFKALKETEKAYYNTPQGTINRRCDGNLPKLLNDGFGEESISLVKKPRPDGKGQHAFAIFQVASSKVFNFISLIPISDHLEGDGGRGVTFKLKYAREALPEILSKDGDKGKGASNNADSFNNPGNKKSSAHKTLREEQNINESADKPRKDKAARKKICDRNRHRVNHPLCNAKAIAASNADSTPVTKKQPKRKASQGGLTTPPKKASKLAKDDSDEEDSDDSEDDSGEEAVSDKQSKRKAPDGELVTPPMKSAKLANKLDTSDESDSDDSLVDADASEEESEEEESDDSEDDSDEKSEEEDSDDDDVEEVDELPDFAEAEETARSEAAINSPAVQNLRKGVKKVLKENLSTVLQSETIMALINQAASKAAKAQAIETTKEQTALALKPIQDQLTLYAQNFNTMLDAQKFAFQKMTDALKKAKIIVNEVRLDETKLAPALKQIEEMEISADQKTFLLNLVKENALEQVEIKACIDSSAIDIMEQEIVLGQESLLLTQEKANEAIASANQLALAAGK